MAELTFDIFDKDFSRSLSKKELDEMIDQMYLDRAGNKDAISKNILSKVELDNKLCIAKEVFIRHVIKNPDVFLPVHVIQVVITLTVMC